VTLAAAALVASQYLGVQDDPLPVHASEQGSAAPPKADFGEAVAVASGTIVIAARAQPKDVTGDGVVHVFERTATGWELTTVLPVPEARVADAFGISLAAGADTIVVGAQFADRVASDAGLAYVFERRDGQWRQAAILTAGDAAADDQFGLTVSVSGGIIVVGARLKDGRVADSGAAYVYARRDGAWAQVAKLTASDPAQGDLFGRASIDAETLIVSADLNDDRGLSAGKAYVYRRASDHWTEVAILHASDGSPGDELGISLALSGQTTVFGAVGRDDGGPDAGAYVFEDRGGQWAEVARLVPPDATPQLAFGMAVAAAADIIVVGAPNHSASGERAGAVYVFERHDGRWDQTSRLSASDAAPWRGFGSSVAVSGRTIVTGVRGSAYGRHPGAAYVFEERGGVWTEVAKLTREAR
jgi:hypothetical protein